MATTTTDTPDFSEFDVAPLRVNSRMSTVLYWTGWMVMSAGILAAIVFLANIGPDHYRSARAGAALIGGMSTYGGLAREIGVIAAAASALGGIVMGLLFFGLSKILDELKLVRLRLD